MAIKGFYVLFEEIKGHVSQIRNINTSGTIDIHELNLLYQRSIQLFFLDSLLAKHRAEYGNAINPLKGRTALYHKLLMKYQWPIRVIVEMTLLESLLALQDEMLIDSLPEEAQKLMNSIHYLDYRFGFDDLLEDEWNPSFADKLLRYTDE
ncbi:ECs1072 family phage-associated protein [Serratia fonticola]|uniref:ECs1072 family phage-associated protein n=1 Tax=Serratia fonticola TaxID=47917 RepID=UPI0034C6C803